MAQAPSLSVEDRLDILDLFARYSWGIDLADKETALSCFTEDSYFDHLWQGRVQGLKAIGENLDFLWYDRQHWWFGRQHLFNQQLMTPVTTETGEPGARVKSFFQILQYNVDYGTNFVFGIGTRDDPLVKRDGKWFFLTLYVNAWLSREAVPWKGDVTMRPKPGATPPPNPNGAPPEMVRELSGAQR